MLDEAEILVEIEYLDLAYVSGTNWNQLGFQE